MHLLILILPFAAIALYVALDRATAPLPTPGDVVPDHENAPADMPASRALVDTIGALVDTVTAPVRKLFELPARAEPYREPIARAEAEYGIPPSLLARLLYQESRFRADIIDGRTRPTVRVNPEDAPIGIAQFRPSTARDLGIDPLNATQAIDGAGRYLRQLYDRFGDWQRAVAAYNWGMGNVARKGIERAPLETRKYVREIFNDVEVA